MEWVETTGQSVEQALDAALDELGVDEDDVEYEVLAQAKSGLFGRIGGNPARIRARVKPVSREKPGERQRRNRRTNTKERSRGGSKGSGGGNGGSRKPRDTARTGGNGSGADRPETPDTAGTRTAGGDADGGGASSSGQRKRRRGGRGRGSGAGGAGATSTNGSERDAAKTSPGRSGTSPTKTPSRTAGEETAMETIEGDVSIEEQAEIAETFTRGLVEAFDLGASVEITIDEDTILISVDGAEVGLLVGPKGATLTAIEELVRTVVQRQTDGHGARINVDVGGYRAKRREALEAFTHSLAEKVIETGRPQALEPMSAMDRKTVHDAASEIDGVLTVSEGEDPRRRVVLRPA
jgi:spoIIIJ-associated protein